MKSQKTILAIGAHPDDIEFGCGAILLKEKAAGSAIHLLVGSKGESGTNGTPAEREAESRKAATMLGASIAFEDFGGDAQMVDSPKNTNRIAKRIRELRPQIVLAPHPHENQHPDHTVVGKLAREACRLARYGGLVALKSAAPHSIESLYGYFITSELKALAEANVLIDVAAVYDEWIQLMECHQSQMRTRNYVELQISKARALGLSAGVGYAVALAANDLLLADRVSELPRMGRAL